MPDDVRVTQSPFARPPAPPSSKAPQPGQRRLDLRHVSMVIRGDQSSIEINDGTVRIKRWLSEPWVTAIEEVSAVNLMEPAMLAGYLHIATFSNPSPPGNRFAAIHHPQCVLFKAKQAAAIKELFEAFDAYLAANPPQTRHPEGQAVGEKAMKLDVLPQGTRKIYDAHVGDHDVRFVIMGVGGQAIVALAERLIVMKAGFMAGATGGGRATSFRYSDVVGIEVNTGWINAVIEIVTAGHAGGPQHDWWAMDKDRDPWKLSNTLPLTKDLFETQKEHIAALRKLIDEAKSAPIPAPETQARDVASQLQNLAELRAKGSLSEEEFGEAKRRILNSTPTSST